MMQNMKIIEQIKNLKAFKEGFYSVFEKQDYPLYINFESNESFIMRQKKHGNKNTGYAFMNDNIVFVNINEIISKESTTEAKAMGELTARMLKSQIAYA